MTKLEYRAQVALRKLFSNLPLVDFLRNRWLVLTIFILLFWGVSGGYIGPDYGIYLLFRDLPLASSQNEIADTGAFATPFLCTFYVSLAVGILYVFHVQDRRWKVKKGDGRKFAHIYDDMRAVKLCLNLLPLSMLPFLILTYGYSEAVPPPDARIAKLSALGSALSALLIIFIFWSLSTVARAPELGGIRLFNTRFCLENIVLFLGLVVLLIIEKVALASDAILFLFILLITLHICFSLVSYYFKPVLVGVVITILILGQNQKYKYRFSGMEFFYQHPVKLADVSNSSATKNSTPLFAPFAANTGTLVIITASGGGYRSTFWVASVLDALKHLEDEGQLESFSKSIKLVSGSSGGSVALAYYLTSELNNNRSENLVQQLLVDLAVTQERSLPPESRSGILVDSFSAVMRQLVKNDLLHLFSSEVQLDERGTVLERRWKSLGISFEQVKEAEEKNKIPKIILSPVGIETGEPILITNIPSKYFRESANERIFHLFETYPNIEDKFRLGTAVRMSATFPVISPAVDLPSEPPLRIADGGFFDNQGTFWVGKLLRKSAKFVVRDYNRVVLLEINAFDENFAGMDSSGDTGDCNPQRKRIKLTSIEKLLNAFKWLTAPLEVLLSARQASMSIRSDSEFFGTKATLELEAKRQQKQLVVERFKFTNATDANLSWVLRGRELLCMQAEILRNKNEFDRLGNFWRN